MLLDKESLKTIYFYYTYSYFNDANVARVSAYFSKLMAIHYQQKPSEKFIFDEDIFTHSRRFLRSLNALNIYQQYQWIYKYRINLYQQYVNLMDKLIRHHKSLALFFKSLTINNKIQF